MTHVPPGMKLQATTVAQVAPGTLFAYAESGSPVAVIQTRDADGTVHGVNVADPAGTALTDAAGNPNTLPSAGRFDVKVPGETVVFALVPAADPMPAANAAVQAGFPQATQVATPAPPAPPAAPAAPAPSGKHSAPLAEALALFDGWQSWPSECHATGQRFQLLAGNLASEMPDGLRAVRALLALLDARDLAVPTTQPPF